MYHLTRYKYWFFGVSLLIILPGIIGLGLWGLNLGIDFRGGSTVNLRVASAGVTAQQVQDTFKAAGAQDVKVFSSSALNGDIPANQYAYLSFSRPVDQSFRDAVVQKLSDEKAGLGKATLDYTYYNLAVPGKDNTAMVVVHFDKPVKADAIQAALKDLPKTGPAPVTNEASTATPAASATAGATAQATAGATASATPKATATGTVTAGQSNGTTQIGQTFDVTLSNVQLGEAAKTFRVDTQTAFNADGKAGAKGADLSNVLYSFIGAHGPAYPTGVTSVGPSISNDTTGKAVLAVLFAAVAILFYIAIAFRHVGTFGDATRYGASAIIALLHDVLVVLGVWAWLGHFFDFKVDSLFLTAILTVIGFSVHDTIVVFDRLRENMRRRTSESFETVVDASLMQTLSRSLNTSLTVLFTLAALTLFGGQSIREFTLALLIGIASGTFSSIFNASMILTVWETGEWRRWFGRGGKGKGTGQQAGTPQRPRELAGTRA